MKQQIIFELFLLWLRSLAIWVYMKYQAELLRES